MAATLKVLCLRARVEDNIKRAEFRCCFQFFFFFCIMSSHFFNTPLAYHSLSLLSLPPFFWFLATGGCISVSCCRTFVFPLPAHYLRLLALVALVFPCFVSGISSSPLFKNGVLRLSCLILLFLMHRRILAALCRV